MTGPRHGRSPRSAKLEVAAAVPLRSTPAEQRRGRTQSCEVGRLSALCIPLVPLEMYESACPRCLLRLEDHHQRSSAIGQLFKSQD